MKTHEMLFEYQFSFPSNGSL